MGFTDMWGVDWSQQYAPRKTTPTTPVTTPGITSPGMGLGVSSGSTTSYTPDHSGLAELSKLVNDIKQNAQRDANRNRFQGAGALEDLSTANTDSALRGIVAPTVKYDLGQDAAERGVRSGSLYNNNADYLRALGLTEYDLFNKGQEWLNQATARNPTAPIYDIGTQIMTPEQVAQIDIERQRLQLERERNDIARMAALNRGGYGHGGVVGGTSTPAPNSGRPKIPNVFPFPDNNDMTDPNARATTTTRYPQVNPDSGNWFDQALWENATPTNTGFDPYAGNWWDDPFNLDNSTAGNNWMDEMLWNEATPVP